MKSNQGPPGQHMLQYLQEQQEKRNNLTLEEITNKYTRIEGLQVYFQVGVQSFMIYEALEDEPDSIQWMQTQLVNAIMNMLDECGISIKGKYNNV